MSWPNNDADHRLVSAEAMLALEERLFESGLPVAALMEKAALALSRRLLEDHGEQLRRRGALVLVGPGHNGGDGLVVARELHLAGIATTLWSPFERHRPLTEAHLRHALWLGLPKRDETPEANAPELWIDALLGVGQGRRPGEELEALLAARQHQRPHQLVAVDTPTGLCSDSGRATGSSVATARRTYAIGLIKQGLLQDEALGWVGELVRLDLGLPATLLNELPAPATLVLWPQDRSSAPWPELPAAAGKYGRGRLLLAAGSARYPGAAALAVAGASASGCGCVRAALPAAIRQGLWSLAPHVLLEPALPETADGSSQLGTLNGSGDDRLDAVLIGPGLGPANTLPPGMAGAGLEGQGPTPEPPAEAEDEERTWTWLQGFAGLLVLDADGLNRLAQRQGAAWLRERQGPTWITPHRHEFLRLFPDLSGDPPLEAAAIAAERCQAAVLLKGARSVIASPDGRRWQLGRADARSARTGLGDVLAGYAAGCGARALAALRSDPNQHASGREALGPCLAPLLAAAALEHAWAGGQASQRHGLGVTPLDVAQSLADGEIRTQTKDGMF